MHTFCRAFIWRALTAGVPESVVRDWVGHVDRDVLRLYTHIASATSQAAMRGLSQPSPEARTPVSGRAIDPVQNQ